MNSSPYFASNGGMNRSAIVISGCVLTAGCVLAPGHVAFADTTPKARAAAALKAQLAAMPDHEDKLKAEFTKDTVVLTPDGTMLGQNTDHSMAREISHNHPHARFVGVKTENLIAGGNANVVWFSADLTFTLDEGEGGKKKLDVSHVRCVELLDAAAGWKPVVAAFTKVGDLSYYKKPHGEVAAPTPSGPLGKLIDSPDALAAALSPDAIVLGTDIKDRAVGKAAGQKLLARWSKRGFAIEPADKIHETETKNYAFAVANVNIANEEKSDPPYRVNGLLIAVPQGDGWQVVAASYGAY